MEKIEWSDSLSLGIKEIDEQHAKFIGYINSIALINNDPTKREKARQILNELRDYAKHHFDTEEKYFKKYRYPKTEEHMLEHFNLLKKLEELSKNFLEEKANSKEILEFMQDWFENHLKKHDTKYAKWFKEKFDLSFN